MCECMKKPPHRGGFFVFWGDVLTLFFLVKEKSDRKERPQGGDLKNSSPPWHHPLNLGAARSYMLRFWVNKVYCTPFIGALCACVYEMAARKRVWVAEEYAMTTHSKARLAENLGGWGVGEGRLCEKPFPYLAFFSPFSWRNKKRAKSFSTKNTTPTAAGA